MSDIHEIPPITRILSPGQFDPFSHSQSQNDSFVLTWSRYMHILLSKSSMFALILMANIHFVAACKDTGLCCYSLYSMITGDRDPCC